MSTSERIAEEEQNVSITCTATGQPQPSITWSRAFGSFPEDRSEVTNESLTIYSLTKRDRGIYICKAENILGSASDTSQLTIFSRLRFKGRPPQQVTPIIGSSVHLPCVAESDLKPTIGWQVVTSCKVQFSTEWNTILIRDIKKSHEGSYTCRATNALTIIEA